MPAVIILIERIYTLDGISLSENYYGGKINAAARAYGFDYDFCKFYKSGESTILIYNGNMVIDKKIPDEDEIAFFAKFLGVCAVENAYLKNLKGYEKKRRYLLEKKLVRVGENICEPVINSRLTACYEIVNEAFGKTDYVLWLTDKSHRVRHDISETFLIDNIAFGCVDFVYGNSGYITEIAVRNEYKGKGYGRKILSCIEKNLIEKKLISVRTYAYDDKTVFYIKNGYRLKKRETYFTLKGI